MLMLVPTTVRRRVLKWTVLAGVATTGMGMIAVAAELYLRRTVPIDWTQEYRVPHPILGWTLQPGARYTTYVPEPIRVVYNSRGWREHEHSRQTGWMPRIAVLGDSFIEAYSVKLDDAFSSRLERLAAKSGWNAEVLNFGVGGYGTLQEYLAFTEIVRHYEPRLVLLGFHLANDVRNNDLSLESIVKTGRVKVTSRPFLDTDADSEWAITPIDVEEAQRQYDAERERRELWPLRDARKSVLLRLAGRVIRQAMSIISACAPTVVTDADTVDSGDLARLGVHFCEEVPKIADAWAITARILERLRDDVDAAGATLVIFTVPALEEVSAPAMRAVLSLAADPDRICLDRAPGYNRLANVLEKLDIPMVDLLPAFRAAMPEGHVQLFRRDGHWS